MYGINHHHQMAMTAGQRRARSEFAKLNLHRDWTKVIFSDEKTFQTQRGPITAWGWISIDGPGEIIFLTRPLKRSDYLEILEEVLLPTLEISYEGEKMVFMQVM